jgi:hypothetical protein
MEHESPEPGTEIAPAHDDAIAHRDLPRAPERIHGQTFAEVHDLVRERASRNFPDTVVHVEALRATTDDRIVVPELGPCVPSAYAHRQLATMLGFRARWFETSSPEERAEELNRRFARIPGEKKIRVTHGDGGQPVIRAFLGANYQPIDDLRILDGIASLPPALLDEYRFTHVELTETTSTFTAVHSASHLVGVDDELHPGFCLRNSEVGAAPVSLDDYFVRIRCMNGLVTKAGDKRSLYRRHGAIDDDVLHTALVTAIARLPKRWSEELVVIGRAAAIDVEHPDSEVELALAGSGIARHLVEAAQQEVLRAADRTRWGVAQAITWTAHRVNQNPDVRFEMERLAGEYLAAT